MEKQEVKKTSSALPKFISVTAVIAIVVLICYVATRSGGSTSPLSTADPSDVVLKLSDLPSGWSETMSTYKSSSNYETNFPSYTGNMPETGYYISFSKNSKLFVSEAMRFSSAADADSFYDYLLDYLYGRLPPGAGVQPATIGDKSTIIIVGENFLGLFRKSNFIVNNGSEVEFNLSEFTNYLQLCESRI